MLLAIDIHFKLALFSNFTVFKDEDSARIISINDYTFRRLESEEIQSDEKSLILNLNMFKVYVLL